MTSVGSLFFNMARPPRFNTPEDLEREIESFFLDCGERSKMPTKGNLALYLDVSRETLSNYEDKPEFLDTVKRAYAVIEDAWVQSLSKQSVAGSIFYLKNAFKRDWRDRTEIEHGGDLKIQFAKEFNKDAPATPPSKQGDSQ